MLSGAGKGNDMRHIIKALGISCALLSVTFPANAQDGGRFPSPEAAMDAVVKALDAHSRETILEIFGPASEDVLSTGEGPRDKATRELFLELIHQDVTFVKEENTTQILLGTDGWPFAIPLRTDDKGYYFDVEAARDVILRRRVGLNELDIIDLLHGYVEIQAEYRLVDHDNDNVLEFALHVISSEGTRDGLYWPGGDSPAGDFIARALLAGYTIGDEDLPPEPFAGYYFHMLDSQGVAAPGGAVEYIINGNRIAGHAMLAIPAEYGVTGVMTFMVSENGQIMEADLGEYTLSVAQDIDSYNPDDRWTVVVSTVR